jgi:hypothetical protein
VCGAPPHPSPLATWVGLGGHDFLAVTTDPLPPFMAGQLCGLGLLLVLAVGVAALSPTPSPLPHEMDELQRALEAEDPYDYDDGSGIDDDDYFGGDDDGWEYADGSDGARRLHDSEFPDIDRDGIAYT